VKCSAGQAHVRLTFRSAYRHGMQALRADDAQCRTLATSSRWSWCQLANGGRCTLNSDALITTITSRLSLHASFISGSIVPPGQANIPKRVANIPAVKAPSGWLFGNPLILSGPFNVKGSPFSPVRPRVSLGFKGVRSSTVCLA
jgi:hypothetical protein